VNAALGLARLGEDSHFLGRLGGDAFGRQIERYLQDNGVATDLAVRTGRSSEEGLVSWPVLLRWEKGDWKVVAPASNSWGQEPVDSVPQGGFTEWNV